MAIWRFKRRQPDLTQDPEARAITFQDLWGNGASFRDAWGSGMDVAARSVSIDRALSLTSVYAATSLIADLISACPLHAYRRSGDVRTELDPPPSLALNPSQFGTTVDWVHRCVISMALRGNAYGFVTGRDRLGYPTQIEWMHPDDVTVMDNRTEGSPDWRYRGRPIDRDLIVHIPYYTVPGYILGLSPLKAYALAVDVGLYASHFGRDYFRNGSIPAGILRTDQRIDDEAVIDVIKARFKRNAARREPVVLGNGLDYKTIAVAPNESQFLETLRFTAAQIAAIYHLRPEMIGGDTGTGSSLTYANVEQRALETVKLALMPYIRRIEEALYRQLPGKTYLKFNLDSFLRADLETRYKAHSLALTNGWMSKDEVRDIEDLSPMPRGLGGFPKPVPPAADQGTAASGTNGGTSGTNGSTSGTNGTTNGGAPAGSPSTNGRAPASGGRRLSGWDPLIALHGRRSDPWI